MAKRKCVLSETRHGVSCACGLQLVSQDPAASALPALAAAPEVLPSRHRPTPTGPAPRTKAEPQEALTSFKRKAGTTD